MSIHIIHDRADDRVLDIALERLENAGRKRDSRIYKEQDLIGDGQAVASGYEESVITLTDEQKRTLKGNLSEAVASLQTIKDEQEHFKDIAEKVQDDLGINKKAFQKTARLVFRGKLEEETKLMEEADEVYAIVSEVL